MKTTRAEKAEVGEANDATTHQSEVARVSKSQQNSEQLAHERKPRLRQRCAAEKTRQ